MNNKSKIYVVDTGMITPVGANTEMTAASVRAEISTYKESNYFDEDFNKLKMSVVPQELLDESLSEEKIIGDLSPRQARMLQLSKLALVQIEDIPKGSKLSLFLAGPENTNANDPQLTKNFIENIANQCDIELDIENSRIISTGRAGGLDAIELALRYLDVADSDYVLVGAVDTFHEKSVLDYYLSQQRLSTDNSMDGFIPGEAAAFLLLSKHSPQNNAELWPFILEPGVDQEKGHLLSKETYTGSGLAAAVTKALTCSGITNIKNIYSSMNGENHFAKELGVTIIRNKHAFDEDYELLHPADCFGDLGAAVGIVMVGMACVSLKKQQDSPAYLVCCSSDSAMRSAAIVSM